MNDVMQANTVTKATRIKSFSMTGLVMNSEHMMLIRIGNITPDVQSVDSQKKTPRDIEKNTLRAPRKASL